MKKPSLILRKKHIILSCLTLMLAIAVYVNYAISDSKLETVGRVEEDAVTYGDTVFVGASVDTAVEETLETTEGEEAFSTDDTEDVAADTAAEYFAQARLDRTSSRDETVATLQTILGGGDQTEDELVTDAIAAVETSRLIESESTIESLIKAQGYADCIVYLDGDSAKVVVQTEGLDTAQAAAIKEVILGEVSVSAENIRIFEVK